MTIGLDAFRAVASGGGTLRMRSDETVTTAPRSLGGRVVRWVRGGFSDRFDRRDNARLARAFKDALKAEYGALAKEGFSVKGHGARGLTTADVRRAIDRAAERQAAEAARIDDARGWSASDEDGAVVAWNPSASSVV